VAGTDIYLLGNGYATLTVRNPAGKIVFRDTVPFLPQDANLTSLGIVKVPDGLAEQVGLVGMLYPTRGTAPARSRPATRTCWTRSSPSACTSATWA
jgi:cytochrome c biogenesis protein